jgi:hypothetical protein
MSQSTLSGHRILVDAEGTLNSPPARLHAIGVVVRPSGGLCILDRPPGLDVQRPAAGQSNACAYRSPSVGDRAHDHDVVGVGEEPQQGQPNVCALSPHQERGRAPARMAGIPAAPARTRAPTPTAAPGRVAISMTLCARHSARTRGHYGLVTGCLLAAAARIRCRRTPTVRTEREWARKRQPRSPA